MLSIKNGNGTNDCGFFLCVVVHSVCVFVYLYVCFLKRMHVNECIFSWKMLFMCSMFTFLMFIFHVGSVYHTELSHGLPVEDNWLKLGLVIPEAFTCISF